MLALAAIGTAGMQGYYGGWSYITIERTQLEHSRQLLATTGGALVIGNIAPTAGWPDASTAGYVRLKLRDPGFDSALDDVRKSLLHKEVATSEDVEILEGAAPKKGPTRTLYVVFPRQVVAYGEYVGWFPTTFIPSLIARLSVRPGWTKVADDANTVIFAYTTVRKRT